MVDAPEHTGKETRIMTATIDTPADIRRDMLKLERRIGELAKISAPEHALRLIRASDLLTEARACDLYRLR
jgi:hypothetical protein